MRRTPEFGSPSHVEAYRLVVGATRVRARLGVAACALCIAAVPQSAAPDQQTRLDTAMAAVDERMVAAGWESPPDFPGGPPPSPGPAGSPVVDVCGYDAFGNVRSAPWFFPGEQARAYSDLWERQTEALPAMHFEDVMVLTTTVDDAGFEAVTAFVDAVGSPEHGECMDAQVDTVYEQDYIAVETQFDLGIGDRSARLAWTNLVYTVDDYFLGDVYAVALLDHTVVLVWYSVVGQPYSGFDPVAELATIVGSLT
jgi:hypothetical protein